LAVGCLFALTVLAAWAGPQLVAQSSPAATLVWAPAQGADGYVVYWGSASGTYSNSENVGPDTHWQIPATAADQTVYMVVVAYDADGQISEPSGEVSHSSTSPNRAPDATDDQASTNEDTATGRIAVTSNDVDPDGDTLSVTSAAVTDPALGTVAINDDETLTFTPALDFHGSATITYTVLDGRGGSDTASVLVTVAPVNDAPKAVDDRATVSEDSTSNSIAVVANDTDVDDTTLTVDGFTDPPHGTVTVSGGSVLYTPDVDYIGQDSFTYTVRDASGLTDIGEVVVTVDNANDAPVAGSDAYNTDEDTALNVGAPGVLSNDSDPDEDSLTAAVATTTSHGTLALNANGSFTYTPAANFSGSDSFTYTLSDGNGGSATGTVEITVNALNDAPVAVDDPHSIDEDTVLTVAAPGVLGNDTDGDSDGSALSAIAVAGPTHGKLELSADGSFSYIPAENFSGTDSFSYKARDGAAESSVATVSITVNPVNDGPIARDDTATTDEDTSVSGNVLANDTDVEEGELTAVVVAGPASGQGTLVLGPDGAFTFAPAANFSGTASFTYKAHDGTADSNVSTVTIAVSAVNDAPAAANDEFSTGEDVAVSVPARGVLMNDTDVDSDAAALTALVVTNPANGTVALNADGSFTYTPKANFSGSDSFTYRANDGTADSNVATVAIAVSPVNDQPAAVNDEATIDEDSGPNAIPVLANDTDPDGDRTTISAVTPAAHGSVVIIAEGTGLTYAPAQNYSGPDTFTYTISDGTGTATATVNLLVNNVNDAPVAADDALTIAEDSSATAVDVLANDTDPDGDSRTVTAVSQGANGAVVISAGGTGLTYAPKPNFAGADTFTYTIEDGKGGTDTASVSITVTAVNDAPVAVDDAFTANEDVVLTVLAPNVLSNDTDPDGDAAALSAVVVSGPSRGTLTLNGNGSFTYAANENFNGTDTFTYKASDGSSDSNVATVTVTVASVNDAPEAGDDTASTNEDVAVDIAVLANDNDPDGGAISVASVGAAANGTPTINADGSIKYTPNANYNGSDTFSYTVADSQGGSASARVTVTIAPVNDGPTAGDDTATTNEDVAVNIAVLANDSDGDGGILKVSAVGVPAHGSASLNANGTVTYTPNADYFGADTFSYSIEDGQGATASATVTVSIAPVNDGPTAANDNATTDEDVAVNIPVLANDGDSDAGTLAVESASAARNGTTSVNSDGSIRYTPAADYFGPDTFSYTITDGQGGTASASVTVMVSSVNDGPAAADDAATTNEDEAVAIAVLANDKDADGGTLSVTTVGAAANGTTSLNANGTISYTPKANFSGSDSFTYRASDGTAESNVATVTITVNSANDGPVAADDVATVSEDSGANAIDVLTNDSDPESDALNISTVSQGTNGSVAITGGGAGLSYAPNANFSGTDSFTYIVSDGNGGTATGTVTVTISAVNDGPTAVDDAATTAEETAADIRVLANDTDADGGTLEVTAVGSPAHGSAALGANGTVRYVPNANYSGADTFTYTISDGQGGSATANVTVTVTVVNDAPVAVDDSYATTEDTPVTGNLVTNDTDADGDALSAARVNGPSNGTLVLAADGSFTYTPKTDFTGTDSFTYTANDADGGSATATVTITVNGANDAPVANPDSAEIAEDSAGYAIAVLLNDSDADGDMLSVTAVTQGTNGAVVIGGGGVTYTPNPNYSGADSFTYTVGDGQGGSTSATVTVSVTSVNDAPVALDDTFATAEDMSAGGNVLANDTDVDGGALTATLVASTANGALTVNADGSFTYTPNPNFSGSDSFTYAANDGNGGSDTATVTIAVNEANDAPTAANDTYATNEDTLLTVPSPGVLGNDSDADSQLTVALAAGPANGTLALNGDGSFTYVPNADFSGTDGFTYRASDGTSSSDASVVITINAVNDAPVAAADAATVVEDSGPTPIAVLGNDTDADDTTLTVTAVTQPVNGTVAIALGGIAYTPHANFVGSDSFSYTVSDAAGASATATVAVTVTAIDDAPVATDDAATTNEEMPVGGNVLANDVDAENGALSAALVSGPAAAQGTVVLNADGSFMFTPAPNFNGVATFTYRANDGASDSNVATVSIAVTPVNDGPTSSPDSYFGRGGAMLIVDAPGVLANDADQDNALTAVIVSEPAHGTVSLNADGGFTYTPAAGFSGPDSFTYQATDGSLSSETATVSILVATELVIAEVGGDTRTVTTDSDGTGPSAADPVVTAVTSPVDGTITIALSAASGEAPAGYSFLGQQVFIAAPAAVAENPISLVFTLHGAMVPAGQNKDTIVVFRNGVPVAACDAGAGTAASPDPCVATRALVGGDDIQFSIRTSAASTWNFGTSLANAAPVASDESYSVDANEPLMVSAPGVLGNDTDADGNTLAAAKVEDAANGTVTLNADGSFAYTPNAGFSGTDRFTYVVSDGQSDSNVATVSITVNDTSHPPVAGNDSTSVAEDSGATAVDVLANDTDPDGDPLTITSVTQGANGAVALAAGGSGLTYTPNANFAGNDSFTYTISDGTAVATATVSVSVSAVNDKPTANDDTATVFEAVASTIDVLANDTTIEAGETLSIKSVTQPQNGTVTISGAVVRYTPAVGVSGADRFTYTIQDGNGETDTASVTVTVVGKPTITVTDVEVVEGNIGVTSATLTVRLSHAVPAPVTVKYATSDGIARAGQDYEASSGTVTFAAGELAKPLTVKVIGDGAKERNEVFAVSFSSPTNASIGRSSGYVTILDDDSSVATNDLSPSGSGRGDRDVLRLRALDDQVARAGDRVELDLKVRNGDLEDLTVSVEGLPSGLRYDAREGAIVGRLSRNDSAGEYTVTVKVSNGRTESTGTFDWIVRAPKGSS
jgi:VCBS repeat-containing protein